ncbi:unnamed protein product, partial [Ixodes persulcatus]
VRSRSSATPVSSASREGSVSAVSQRKSLSRELLVLSGPCC